MERLKTDCFVNFPVDLDSNFVWYKPRIVNIQNCLDSEISFLVNEYFIKKLQSKQGCEQIY